MYICQVNQLKRRTASEMTKTLVLLDNIIANKNICLNSVAMDCTINGQTLCLWRQHVLKFLQPWDANGNLRRFNFQSIFEVEGDYG